MYLHYTKEKKIKKEITPGRIVCAIAIVAICTSYNAIPSFAENEPKLSEPKMIPEGTYLVPNNKEFCEQLSSDEKDSTIYYTLEENKSPEVEGIMYEKPIFLVNQVGVIKAVNTKEGFLNSGIVKRKYSSAVVSAPMPYHGIKAKKVKKGSKMIKGTLKFSYHKLPTYIKITVRTKKGNLIKYKTKVKNKKWAIKLKRSLKKGDKVRINAYTKEYVVHFKKVSGTELTHTMEIMKVYFPTETWIPVRKTL